MLLWLGLKHTTCQTWVLGADFVFEPCKHTFSHIILKEGKGD